MGTVWNIRGTNGSGKSTLARAVTGELDAHIVLNAYPAPTKKEPERLLRVRGYLGSETAKGPLGLVGPYHTACGGLDGVPSFAVQRGAITHMLTELDMAHVIAEGVLASTVFGSWHTYADALAAQGHTFAFVYMHVPLEVCLSRIRERQRKATGAERPIKEDQVASKIRAIEATRARAIEHSHLVYDLPFMGEAAALVNIMDGHGEEYRASLRSH